LGFLVCKYTLWHNLLRTIAYRITLSDGNGSNVNNVDDDQRRQQEQRRATHFRCGLSTGTDVMTLKIFFTISFGKKFGIFIENTSSFCKFFIITLVFMKNTNFSTSAAKPTIYEFTTTTTALWWATTFFKVVGKRYLKNALGYFWRCKSLSKDRV
jgi:hypothetical protein